MNISALNHAIMTDLSLAESLLPHLQRLHEGKIIFEQDFGLCALPEQPGFLSIRGPRQFGKSTWLEQKLFQTLCDFGLGTAFYINGDYLASHLELFEEIRSVIALFPPSMKIQRIFIDEITAIPQWEVAIKKLADSGESRHILFVTTGSSATDLHRGVERLPGRKGKLDRTNYYFTPISYKSFYDQAYPLLKEKTLAAYIISGGSPLACQELILHQKIPTYVFETTKEWIEGEIFKSRRDRAHLIAVFQALYKYGGTPVGQAKLARETQLSNNTIAHGYVELLRDLGCVTPAFCIDNSITMNFKKPCKYHITNLLTATLYQRERINSPEAFVNMEPKEQGKWIEWVIAQEILRRRAIRGDSLFEPLKFWQTKEHELDFYDDSLGFIEAKRGQASAQEFSWFPKSFPDRRLNLIAKTPYQTSFLQAVTLEEFLLAEG